MTSSYRIKGCKAENINKLVSQFVIWEKFFDETEYNRRFSLYVNDLAYQIVHKYSTKECINLIIANGNILDAMKKSSHIRLDLTDDLVYHRQLCFPYITEWITNKINVKLYFRRFHSICKAFGVI